MTTDGAEPIITEEQGQRLMAALTTWGTIYYQEKGEYPQWNHANITKSCLLGRLIYEGKEPLPVPPPRFMSAPWYSLIENGRSYFHRRFGMWRSEDRIVIGQDGDWSLIEERDDGSLVVEYPRNGRWLVRPTRDDEKVEGGRSIANGKPEPIYFDTVIERLPDAE